MCYVLLALVASVAKTPPPEDGDDGAARGIVGDELGDEIPLPGNDEDGGGGADGTDNRRAGDLSQTGDPSSSGDPSWRGDASSTAVPLVVLVPMVAYMWLNVAGEVTFGSWIFTVARAREGLSVSTAAALTSTFWACFTATRFALGLIPDLRPLTALAWSHVAALSALATLAMYWSGSVDASGWALWLLTGSIGAGTAGLFPNSIAQGRRMFPLTGLRQALFELGPGNSFRFGSAFGLCAGPFFVWASGITCSGKIRTFKMHGHHRSPVVTVKHIVTSRQFSVNRDQDAGFYQ